MDKFLESVNKRDFDRRISEVVEMLEEKQLYGTISLITAHADTQILVYTVQTKPKNRR